MSSDVILRERDVGSDARTAIGGTTSRRTWLVGAAIGLIVVAAAVLRFADLSANPGGLFPDEAAEGLSALRLLHEPGYHPVLVPDGGGREALFAYIVAVVFRFAGESTLALRATAAGLGVLGVGAIWLLGRRFGDGVGLIAAGWAAGSLWLIAVSRDGMRNTMVPLFGALALSGLAAWAERPSQRMAALAGAIVSISGLYTYQPLKLLPLLVIAWLAWLRHVNRPSFERLRVHIATFVVAFLVVGGPMIIAAILDPGSYFGRAVGVTPLNPGVVADSTLVTHWLRTIGMFAVSGDPNARHDVAGWPLFGWPVLGWLLMVVALAGLARLWRNRRDPGYALLLLSLPIFFVPAVLAIEGGSPHFLRVLGLAAPLGVTIGLGATELAGHAKTRWGSFASRAVTASIVLVLVTLALVNGRAYLSRPIEERYEAYSFDLVALAQAARDRPGQAVLLDDYSAYVVRFLDADRLPGIVSRTETITQPGLFSRLLARNPDDLRATLGPELGARAQPIAWDPQGRPTVWAVVP